LVVRFLLIVAGTVTSWFVARDAVIFGVAQVMVALLLITLGVAILAFWPSRWIISLKRFHKPG